MQSKLVSLIVLICLVPALLYPLAVAEPSIDLDFYKNNGYGVGDNIGGTWTVTAIVSSDVKYVEFYLDDQLQQNDTSAPFSWQFDTSNYPAGSHAIKAVGYDSMGDSAFLQVERNFQETSTSTIAAIIFVVVIVVVVVSIGLAIYLRKREH
jgi:hypothetical protein